MKTAISIDDQIDKLKDRGMNFPDENKAREILRDIGYFRLGFYWFPFEKSYPRKQNRDHNFKEDTSFKDVVSLYYFDFDLRNILLRYISRIEINFRNNLIYQVSNKHKGDPFWYINPKFVNEKFLNDPDYIKALDNCSKEPVIKNDRRVHQRDFAPAWKELEFLNFGNVILLYDNLKDGKLKQDISLRYGMDAPSQFFNYIDTIRYIRNACAHGKVLYDMMLPTPISSGPLGYLGNYKST